MVPWEQKQLTKLTKPLTKPTTNLLRKKILFLIEYNLRLTQAQIADELDVPKSTVKYYVSKLSKAKIIKREGTVHNGRWIIL
ncbi:MAG: MarR family transcriptional regulator [Clostridia bacterium]|nr:MarR family transcriptional regulator [Clostridia bacterium]